MAQATSTEPSPGDGKATKRLLKSHMSTYFLNLFPAFPEESNVIGYSASEPCEFDKMPVEFVSSCYKRKPDGTFYSNPHFLVGSEGKLADHDQMIRHSELVDFGGDDSVRTALGISNCVGRIEVQYEDDALSKSDCKKGPNSKATGLWVQGRFFLTAAHVIFNVTELDESREPRAPKSGRLIRGKVTMERNLIADARPEYVFNVKLLTVSAQNDFAIFELVDTTHQPTNSLDVYHDFLACDGNIPVFSLGYCGKNKKLPNKHPNWWAENGIEEWIVEFEEENNRKANLHDVYGQITVQNSADTDFKKWVDTEEALIQCRFDTIFIPDRQALAVGKCFGPTIHPELKMDKFQMFSMNLSSFHGLSGAPVGCVRECSGELRAYVCGLVYGGDYQNNLQLNSFVGFTSQALEFMKNCIENHK